MELLVIGQKISLFFLHEDSMIEMVCAIDSVDNDRLTIVLPQYFMRYINYLKVGCELTAKVFTKYGTIDFNTIVISSPLEDNFVIELDYNSIKLTKSEDMPMIGAVEKISIKYKNKTYNLDTFGISADAVKFTTFENFKINENIDCILTLPKDYGIIKFKAVITEIDPVYDNEYTASIITMEEEARQNLLYFIYVYGTNYDWKKDEEPV